MGRRERLVSTSILRAIFRTKSPDVDKPQGIIARIVAFFAVFQLALSRYRGKLFRLLRNEIWGMEEEEYTESFRSPSKGKRTDLIAIGDLGYSGSVRSYQTYTLTFTNIVRRFSQHRIQSFSSNRFLAVSNNPSSATACSNPTLNTWS
jgi:hypothetical protein